MKKFLVLSLLCIVATVSVQAQKGDLTDDQKAVKKEMLDKYDADKNGKLDKDERAKMTDEDKAKWAKAFPHKKKSDASTNAAPSTADAPKN